jgi:hydrogenase nickel incorporation protein HypA/HybF
MHEAMIAENILQTILAQTQKRHGKVIRVAISCGQMNVLNDEAMRFAFEAAAAGTICEGAKLKIKHIPLKGICRNCGSEFEFDLYDPKCPKCGKSDFSIGEDAPLLLEVIEFEACPPQARKNNENKSKQKNS